MKLIVLFTVIASVFGKNELHRGWKSYYIIPETETQLVSLVNRTKYVQDIDVLSHPHVGRKTLALVKPLDEANLLKFLDTFEIPYRNHSADVKEALDNDVRFIRSKRQTTSVIHDHLPYNSYLELDLIYKYLDDIARSYPKKVKLIEPAHSSEGRKIKYLKISTTNFNDSSKPIIFIDGGIHGRDWITIPVVTWAVHKLVVNVTEPDLLDKFDWILLPIVNPDGYEYSFTSNRFWRKTRSNPHNEVCSGVDADKNFDFFWNTVGTSFSPCDETYAGTKAFSEIETRVVRDILIENLDRMSMYLTVHSYGSMILYPWGHDGSPSENLHALRAVALAMSEAIHAHQLPFFPRYIVGNSALVLFYGSAGASDDYAHMIGVPLSFNIELPGLANGLNGFHLEEEYIEQVCRETWEGFVAGARFAFNQLNLTGKIY